MYDSYEDGSEKNTLADMVRGKTERTVEKEVDFALRRMDEIDEDEREVIEEAAEKVAERLMHPIVKSLEDDGGEVDMSVFEKVLFED